MFVGSLPDSKVLKDDLVGLEDKWRKTLEFREMPKEEWPKHCRREGPYPRAGIGSILFSFALGWLVLRAQ